MKIPFSNQQHLDRFLAAIQSIGKVYGDHFGDDKDKIDCYYGSALYILSDDEWTLEKANRYISSRGIDFETMLQEVDFSGGYTVLLQWASNLFNGNIHVDPVELMRLDEHNFRLALIALQFRYYGAIHTVRLEDLEVRQQ